MRTRTVRRHRTHPTRWSLPRFLLRKWLRGRWVLLFSHPDDFANYGFEADRWIAQVKEVLDAESVAAVAIGAQAAADAGGWIGAVGGCFISPRTFEDVVRQAHGTTDQRFVMVLDDELQLRRTFEYSSADRLPSPIGLASFAATYRFRGQAGELQSA